MMSHAEHSTLSALRRISAAVLTGLAVAVAAHLGTTVALFIGRDLTPASLGQISSNFLVSSAIFFLLIAIAAAADAFSGRVVTLLSAIVAAVLAALVGTALSVIGSGGTITPELVGPLFSTLLGVNLVFVLAAIIATLTVGPRVWAAVTGWRVWGRADGRQIALVRLPSTTLDEGIVTHIERSRVDIDRADEQWDTYVAALAANGWETVEVAAAPELPDSVFVEDAVVVFGKTAIIASPGAPSRVGETAEVEQTVRDLGLKVQRIELPGTLDGGDVLTVGTTVYVGRGGRTNAEGIRQLRSLVHGLGYTVVAVPVTKALHLKSAVTALPDGTVIGHPPRVDDPSVFDRFLAVPEAAGAHVVVLAPDAVLMSASAPQSAALIADLGYRVVTVDVSEFEKLEGSITCLSVRIR